MIEDIYKRFGYYFIKLACGKGDDPWEICVAEVETVEEEHKG